MWLQAGIYKNMLSVSVLTMEINGSVETSGLIQLLKCWCRWKYFRSMRHVAGTYNTGETHVLLSWLDARQDTLPELRQCRIFV